MTVKRFDFEKEYSLDINIIPVEESDGAFVHYDDYAALQQKLVAVTEQRDAVVAENAVLKGNINKLENWPGLEFYSSAWEFHESDGFDASELICDIKTPATDAAIAALRAEVLAEAIPDGYALVPQEMHLPAKSMEGICFHCGDGDHNFGEFTDGTLFVGEVDYGDGKKVYGLHIATADYPEEGCATICEFARQLRESKGAQS